MSDRPQTHKKIYQIAKEINISHETLIDYLKKRGHAVKSHMSVVDDQMMHDINSHFKKDKEVAEKHQRKIQSIRESRKKVEAKAAEPESAKEKPSKKAKTELEEPVAAPAPPPVVEIEPELPVEEPAIEAEVEVEELEVEEQPEAAAIEETPAEEAPAEPAPAESKPKKKEPEIMARRTPKMGLKIKGKIDLDEVNRANAVHEGAGPDSDKQAGSDADAAKKKKKKKRILRDAPAPAPVEEVDDLARKSKKKKKLKHREVDKGEVESAIKRTLAEIDESGTPTTQRAAFKKKRREKRAIEEQRQLEQKEREKSILRVTEFVSVHELANLMGVNVAEVIKKCIELGLMVSINQRLDKDTITLVADEYGLEVKFFSELTEALLSRSLVSCP